MDENFRVLVDRGLQLTLQELASIKEVMASHAERLAAFELELDAVIGTLLESGVVRETELDRVRARLLAADDQADAEIRDRG